MAKKIVTYIIDLLIILAIIVVGIYGYKLLGNTAKGGNGGSNQVLLKIEFEKNEKELLEKITVGDELFDSSKNEFIGVVESLEETKPTLLKATDYSQNKVVLATNEDYGLKTITVLCNATVTPSSVHVNNTEVRIGTTITVRTNRYALTGKVMGIEVLK